MNILVTGGGSDISRAIIKKEVDQGKEVFFTSSNEESLQKNLEYFSEQGIKVRGFLFELSRYQDDLPKLAAELPDKIDGLILSAYTKRPPMRKFHQYTDAMVEEDLSKNLIGNTLLTKLILNRMIEQKFGRIVLLSSISTEVGTSRYPTYVTGKSGLEGLLRNIAVDYGEHGILANTLRLGIIKTSRTKKHWKKEEYHQKIEQVVPMRRLGEPEDVANAVHSLLQDKMYVNGATINVTGGLPLFRTEGLM